MEVVIYKNLIALPTINCNMRKSKFIFATIMFSFIGIHAHSQNYLWAKSAAGTNNDYGFSITADAGGNVYVTGFFASSAITFGTTTLNNLGGGDLFVVKYNSSGNVLWARSSGGTFADYGRGIAVDSKGFVYVTGEYNSASITFENTKLTNISSSGENDFFVVKYDSNGKVIWAKTAGGKNGDETAGIALDGKGNSYITGKYNSPVLTVGTTTVTTDSITGNASDIFISKLDTLGSAIWTKSAKGLKYDYSTSIAVDAAGNSYITGSYYSTTLSFGTTVISNSGNNKDTADIFVAKYDSDGKLIWAKSAGGASDDFSNSIAVDGNGNSYLTGSFMSPVIKFGTIDIAGKGNHDMFVVKYDGNGIAQWAKTSGGGVADYGRSIAADAKGNTIVTGEFNSSSLSFGTTTITNVGNYDFYFVQYDPLGMVLEAKGAAGGINAEYGRGVAVDPNGNIYLTGSFKSTSLIFGNNTLTNTNNLADVFVVKYGNVTGIKENTSGNHDFVFPNRSNGLFTIFSPPYFDVGPTSIEIVNLLGEKVYAKTQPFSPMITIDLMDQKKGVYFIRIFCESKSSVQKIIIE